VKRLTSAFELREGLLLFFKDNNKASFLTFLKLKKLDYLADISSTLNILNINMQGSKELTYVEKILAFKNELKV
jgi:hypothetical protein